MDEPLLGYSQKRSSANLFKICENQPTVDPAPLSIKVPVPISPLEFKEKLVYGSLDSPSSYYLPSLFGGNDEQLEAEELLLEGECRRGEETGYLRTGLDGEPIRSTDSYQVESSEVEELSLSSFSSGDECLLDVPADPEQGLAAERDFPFRRKTLKKSRTAPALNVRFSRSLRQRHLERPKLDSATTVVMKASLGLLLYLAVGMGIYVWRRDDFSGVSTLPLVDGIYFCIVTMCTIGYGDITPVSPQTKLFACFFVLVGFGFIDILLSGMVAYVLERQEHLLLSAVEGQHHQTARNYLVNTKKGRMRIRTKVGLALAVVILCLAIGTVVMHWIEGLGWVDAFYLSCMSVTTVGYGDHSFKTVTGRLFAAGWLLVSTLAVARSFLFLAEARIDRRNRLIAKWVLHREMTVGDLVAADIDNNGFVTRSEYVIYKLKEMQKINEKDILDVCRQFSLLDRDNSGRITISCLMNADGPSTPTPRRVH